MWSGKKISSDGAEALQVTEGLLGCPERPVLLIHTWLRNEGKGRAHLTPHLGS